ncbi:MAG: SAM-dependent methyltransferase, partial [Actinomycetota bacterium]|nr:SAM-dependent methyltransferase [Actinomycetota bacterium]
LLADAAAGRPVDSSVEAVLAAEAAAGVGAPSGLRAFGLRAQQSATAVASYLTDQQAAGRRVLAYGAPSKASVLLGVSAVGPDLLPFTVDASVAKHGLSIPGVRIPIRPVEELIAAKPDVVLVLTWDIAEEVMGQLEARGSWGAEYVVPLPEPHRVEA